MDEFLNQLEFGGASAVTVTGNLALSLLLALMTTFTYRKTHSGFSYSPSFVVSLISVTMTITLIMMVIGNYIALSLGLVGALSVVRFRSAIKDPRDIAYLFLAIAIGLACATSNYQLSIIGALLINAVLLALHYFRFGTSQGGEYCLTFSLDEEKTGLRDIEAHLRAGGMRPALRSYTEVEPARSELVYSLAQMAPESTERIQGLSRAFEGVSNVSLLAPEASMEP